MRKTIRNVVTAGALGLAGLLPGCNLPDDFMRKEYNLFGSYNVVVGINGLGRYIALSDTSTSSGSLFDPMLTAIDNRERDSNKPDGRFDEINLYEVPKGHLFEKYVNLDSLEALWQRSGLGKPKIEMKVGK